MSSIYVEDRDHRYLSSPSNHNYSNAYYDGSYYDCYLILFISNISYMSPIDHSVSDDSGNSSSNSR